MNRSLFARLAVAVALLALLVFATASFQVRENEFAVLTAFGKPVRVVKEPGLYPRAPWPFQTVQRFDARLDFYEVRISEALTLDKRNVVVPVFVAWRIADPLRFLQAVGSAENARAKFDALVTSARNSVLAAHDFRQLVSTDGAALRIVAIEEEITRAVRAQAETIFGVAIEKVGVKRLSLPEANTEFVFRRMQAERQQFAAKFRAEGRQQADEIRAQTDAKKSTLVAEARRAAEEIRGKAEAEAAAIYAVAHGQDAEFYGFLRELEVLRQTVGANTTLILDTDSEPFRLLRSGDAPVAGSSRGDSPRAWAAGTPPSTAGGEDAAATDTP
jgi:modulator of FtsH protease HflC